MQKNEIIIIYYLYSGDYNHRNIHFVCIEGLNFLREAAKKVILLMAVPLLALHPPPSDLGLNGHRINIKLKLMIY